jgi:uncharacterized damage-inducible protein DinB
MAFNSMTQKEIIIRQLDRAFHGPAWHGPSVIETLDKISQATASNSFQGSHTIIQLIAHMAVWRKFVTERLNGNTTYEVSEAMNFSSPTDLQNTIQELKHTQQRLLEAIKNFPEENLSDQVPTREYSFQTMLHGILHHDLYHLGQITLLNR